MDPSPTQRYTPARSGMQAGRAAQYLMREAVQEPWDEAGSQAAASTAPCVVGQGVWLGEVAVAGLAVCKIVQPPKRLIL